MAEVLIKEETLTSIADKIREKTKKNDTHKPSEMAAGVDSVYDAGKQAEYDAFWNAFMFTHVGNYQYRFAGQGWTDVSFNPPENLTITTNNNPNYMFRLSCINDLKGILESKNAKIDFSNATSFGEVFAYSNISRIPELNVPSVSTFYYSFAYARSLKSIDKLILNNNGTQTFTNTFTTADKLEDITIEGVIGNSISFSSSPLIKDSIISVVNALSSTASGKTLTLKKTAVNTAFGIDVDDATTWGEGTEFYALRYTKDNWTFSYV